ncbi:MAG TPA: alpha/beta hydrolase [Gemmatimonadaceae bacterium]
MAIASSQSRLAIGAALLACAVFAPGACAQGQYANINGGRIYYEVEGSGHPLVLIHGWPMSARMWDAQARELKNYYQVVRYDRRGFGRSPGGVGLEQSAEHDAQDLEALLRYLKIPHAYIVGHSQGGAVAQQFTLDHPDQVDALILHGAPIDGFVLPETGPFSGAGSVRELMQKSGMAEFRRQWLAHPINHVPADRQEVAAFIADIVAQYSGDDVLKMVPAHAAGVPAIQRLNQIKTPALVLVGGEDLPFFQISADALAFLIPGAQKVVIPGGAHLVNIIEPERYDAEILRFLRAVERSRAH